MLKQAVILCSVVFCLTSAYSSGAPHNTCDTLMPQHGQVARNKIASPIPSPFIINVHGGYLVENNGVVRMSLDGSRFFKGFVLVAEFVDSRNKRHRKGTWSSPNPFVKTACGDGSGLTHRNNSLKKNVIVEWTAPAAPFNGPVSFWGSFVEEKSAYWVELSGTKTVNVVPITTTAAAPTPGLNNPTEATGINVQPTTLAATIGIDVQPTTLNTTDAPSSQPSTTQPKTAGTDQANMPSHSTTTNTTTSTTMTTRSSTKSTTTVKHGGSTKTTPSIHTHKSFAGHPQIQKGRKSAKQDSNGSGMVEASLLCYLAVWAYQLL